MVRAKFTVLTKARVSENGFEIKLTPVVSSSTGENAEFYKLTPAGEIRLVTVNEGSANQLEVGKEYYVDFTKA